MLVDKIVFFYGATGLYMFFLFAMHPEKCPVSTGFYNYFSIVAVSVRPYNSIFNLKKEIEETQNEIIFNICIDIACFIYGVIEISRFCLNETLMWWFIQSVINHIIFIVPQIFVLKRKLETPLISDVPLINYAIDIEHTDSFDDDDDDD